MQPAAVETRQLKTFRETAVAVDRIEDLIYCVSCYNRTRAASRGAHTSIVGAHRPTEGRVIGAHHDLNDHDRVMLLAAVDGLRADMVGNLRDLVRIPSVSPKYGGVNYDEHVGQEGRATGALVEMYREAGASVEIFAVEKGRENAVGQVGSGSGPSLVFNGHVDVVPEGDLARWKSGPPFAGAIVDGHMFGRGTSDQKSGLIAQAFAAIALRRAGVRLAGTLQLQCVVGEETADHACGSGAVVDRGFVGDAVIVSEPTAPPVPLSIALASPGLLRLSVTVEGKKTHSSMRGASVHLTRAGAEIGVNAIDKIFVVYQALRNLENEWAQTQRHPLWENGHFSLLPGVISGGAGSLTVPSSLSDYASIEYAILHSPDLGAEEVRIEVVAAIERAADGDSWLRTHRPKLRWTLNWEPFQTDPEAEICRAISEAYESAVSGTRLSQTATWSGFNGVCDATIFSQRGIPALAFGPGDLRTAHADDESVDLEEVLLAARTFALLAAQWCGVEH